MIRFLMSYLRGAGPRPPAPAPSSSPCRMPLIDVEGMIRQACTRVSISRLLQKGRTHIQVLSRAKIDELINRSVRTIVDKHRLLASSRPPSSAARIEAESRAEFGELLRQWQLTADARSAVDLSRQALDPEFEGLRVEPDPAPAPPPAPTPPPNPAGEARETAVLKKRLEKLLAHVATMEAAIRTMSTAKSFSNQQIQNLFRDLGLAPEDKNFEKKREMLKIVLDTNQGIRRRGRELAARGITLDAPEETAVFTSADDSLSEIFTRSSA